MANEICWYDRSNKSAFSYSSLRLQQYVTRLLSVSAAHLPAIIKSKWVLISQAFPLSLTISIDILPPPSPTLSEEHKSQEEEEEESGSEQRGGGKSLSLKKKTKFHNMLYPC